MILGTEQSKTGTYVAKERNQKISFKFLISCFYFLDSAGNQPKDLNMLGKCCTTELCCQPFDFYFNLKSVNTYSFTMGGF
jgi:hypothetical protein